MRTATKHLNSESGSAVLIATVLILAVMTVIGLSAMNDTTIELTVASNDQQHKIAFYNADSGIYGVPKLVSQMINDSQAVPIGVANTVAEGIRYNLGTRTVAEAQTDFYEQIMGFDPNAVAALTLQPTLNTNINVLRIRQRILAGGGAEFAAGTEGVGVGSQGGVGIFYQMNSQGFTARGSNASVIAEYRKVLGIAGGL